jgi:hypothetical protein
MRKYLLAIIASLGICMYAQAQEQVMVLGAIQKIDGNTLIIENAANPQIIVDITKAKSGDHIGSPIALGRPIVVRGHFEGKILKADSVHKGQ